MVKVRVWKVEWCPNYGTSIVLLKELEGERFLPVNVEEWEAKTIEILLKQKSRQPYKTALLFSYLIENLNAKILRIEIEKGIHNEILAKVVYCDQDETFTITHSPGEAIELAMRCRASIMIPDSMLFKFESKVQQSELHGKELKLLTKKLEKAVKVENFEEAAKIRDQISELKKKMKI